MLPVRAVVATFAIATFAAPIASAASVAVFYDFEGESSDVAISEMKDEVALILKGSGVDLDWRLLKARKASESFADLVVLRFKGSCQIHKIPLYNELGPVVEGRALASTSVSDGHVLPFSEIACDQIRHYLAPEVSRVAPELRDEVFGRALGRVVAHELYHVFVGTLAHAHDGVARSFHTRKDLLEKEFRFTAKEIQVLREVKGSVLAAADAGF